VPQKLDVAIPLAGLARFEAELRPLVARFARARLVLFGHLAEGNLHVNLLGLDPADEAVADAILDLVLRHGGSISSEHGIGVAKVRWLARARGEAETALMRRLKAAFDPGGIMNPGVIFPE
jgi:FAD/FMN-containing dehydrogenase